MGDLFLDYFSKDIEKANNVMDNIIKEVENMTSTEFDQYFFDNFLFDKEYRELEVIVRNEGKILLEIDKFKQIIENIDAEEKILFTNAFIKVLKDKKKFKNNINLLEKSVKQYDFVKNLRFNITGSENNTSILQFAVQWKQPEIVKYLIEKGANINYLSVNNGYKQSILSYLVICNCQFAYMPDLKQRIFEILMILKKRPILSVKPNPNWTVSRKLAYNRLDIFGININPLLIKDILIQLKISEEDEEDEDKDDCPHKIKDEAITCKKINIKKGIQKYLPWLILNVDDSLFIKKFIEDNYASINFALLNLNDKCIVKVNNLNGNTEKKLRKITYDETLIKKSSQVSRALRIIEKTGILELSYDTISIIIKGYYPEHLEMILNIVKFNLYYKEDKNDLATMCLEGLPGYEMSIKTVFEKLEILFKYAKRNLDGPIFNTIKPKWGYTYHIQFYNIYKNNGLLVKLISYSLGMNLKGQNKKDYFDYFEKIIRLIMKYDDKKEVITPDKMLPDLLMVKYIKLFSSKLLSHFHAFIESKEIFDNTLGYVLETFKKEDVGESKETLQTYFKLIKRDVLIKEIFSSLDYKTYMNMVSPLTFKSEDVYKYLVKSNHLSIEKVKFIDEHKRIIHKNISWTRLEIAEFLKRYKKNYERKDLVILIKTLGMNIQDKLLDRIYKNAKKIKRQESSEPYKLKF